MATKISNILVRIIVFFALLGIIFLLTMYNAKLLHTLNWFKTQHQTFDWEIIIIASVAYSLGSIAVVIWYNPIRKEDESKATFNIRYIGSILLKLLFVIIDGVHVYVYINTHIDDLATWLSPVYALQTALILFFVGAIVNDIIKTGKEKEAIVNGAKLAYQNEIELSESKTKKLQTKIELSESIIKDYHSDIEDKKNIIDNHKESVETLESDYNSIARQLEVTQSKIDKYYPVYQKNEVSRIRKMKSDNRTPEETKMLKEYESMQN